MAEPTPDNENTPEPEKEAGSANRAIDFWYRWRAWIIGPVLVGVTGVMLERGCHFTTHLNTLIVAEYPYLPLVMMPLGFALFVYLVRRFFRGAEGSGIGQVVAAVNDTDPAPKKNMISIRIAFGKAILLMAGYLVGGSIGREGPAVQIGASIMHAFYGDKKGLSVERRHNLATAGGAAGLAVAFNTPLAGIVFGIEQFCRGKAFSDKTRMAFTVFVATLAAVLIVGNQAYFGNVDVHFAGLSDLPTIIICGIVGGAIGAMFSRMMMRMSLNPPRFITRIHRRPVIFAAACGLVVALLGLLTDFQVFGSGYEQTMATVHADGSSFVWFYGPIKFIATFICGISGIPAGMFAPAISIGAGLGDTISYFFPSLAPHGTIIVLMMASYLTGVLRTPVTALVITMEMTAGFHLLLPILATVLIANAVSKLLCNQLMYAVVSEKYLNS